MPQFQRALVWLRRDLRVRDNSALSFALQNARETAIAFIFDEHILKKLSDKDDRRLTFIHESLEEIQKYLQERSSTLLVRIGVPEKEIPLLVSRIQADIVCANKDYEPYAKKRDTLVHRELEKKEIPFHLFKDQVIFESLEICTQNASAFKVFTPYKNAWLRQLKKSDYEETPKTSPTFFDKKNISSLVHNWHKLDNIGFHKNHLWVPTGSSGAKKLFADFQKKSLVNYKKLRDFPAQSATSHLSVHLRFGTISIRDCLRKALSTKKLGQSVGIDTWISELIWRDFYHMILDQFPHVESHAFKKEYDSIHWPGTHSHFQAWCEGRTGFPIIDAAMRHFIKTGWMHNRLRMIVASFLTKDLLIDWRKGEAFFARHLLDFDLAANNGGWQWSASTGCDAQPYFRIFNPYTQSKKFDPDGAFIRDEIPELRHLSPTKIHQPEAIKGYPSPLINHATQRLKALELFKK